MFEKKHLEKLGIKVTKKIEDKDIIQIVDKVSNALVVVFPNVNFLDIYKTLLDTKMYYAKIANGLSKVNYYYKNKSMYFSENIDIKNLNEYIVHECIHRIQEKRDRKGKIKRIGLCEVKELSVKATGLNEGAVQYLTTKILGMPAREIVKYEINIKSSTEYYAILTNIISCITYLIGEEILIDSTINGNENFKIAVIDNIGESEYTYIEKSLNEILRNEGKTKELYFEVQKKIYMSYFNKKLKMTENEVEVNELKNKLYGYKNFIGTNEENKDFEIYCTEFEDKAKLRIQNLRNKYSLMVINNNIIFKTIRKIKRLFTNSPNEYYK